MGEELSISEVWCIAQWGCLSNTWTILTDFCWSIRMILGYTKCLVWSILTALAGIKYSRWSILVGLGSTAYSWHFQAGCTRRSQITQEKVVSPNYGENGTHKRKRSLRHPPAKSHPCKLGTSGTSRNFLLSYTSNGRGQSSVYDR